MIPVLNGIGVKCAVFGNHDFGKFTINGKFTVNDHELCVQAFDVQILSTLDLYILLTLRSGKFTANDHKLCVQAFEFDVQTLSKLDFSC